jgi:hypothetical protein
MSDTTPSGDEPTRDEILLLAKHAGLDLPPAYFDQLVEAYGHVRRMVARLPRDRPKGDEPAHVFTPTKFLPPKLGQTEG